MKYITISLSALLILIACKTTKNTQAAPSAAPVEEKLAVVTSTQLELAQKRWPNTQQIELTEGETIFKTKCKECHINYPITDFSEKKWLHEIDDMSPKAKLTSAEKLKLTKHILSFLDSKTAQK